ncbi:hypothetical protein ACTXM3_09685 [Glutamicibacter arilaitensis]|uniref:hypothetical protein n=1 Tax=Glutamicibacter arilaitensis TaxID=256701 RepID=UPI003F91962E
MSGLATWPDMIERIETVTASKSRAVVSTIRLTMRSHANTFDPWCSWTSVIASSLVAQRFCRD